MTAIFGCKCKNDLSNSSASTTTYLLVSEITKFELKFLEIPPKNAEHPILELLIKCEEMVEIDVLPCVPATAIPFCSFVIIPRTSARLTIL